MPTAFLPLRAASRAASLTMLARSAPTKPLVIAATRFTSTSSPTRIFLQVDFQDIFATSDVRTIDQHVAVETTGPQQGGVERFRAVGGGHHDHAAVGTETVHFDEQRVERLLAFVVSANLAAAAGLAERVELVDEDNAGSTLLSLLKHVAHARGTDADKHFDEVRAAKTEKRHARFAGDRFGQQGLAGTRRTNQQHALGNPTAEPLVAIRGFEKVDDFAQFVDRFVDAGDIVEGPFDVFLGVEFGATATKRHRRTGSAHTSEHHDHQQQQHAEQHQRHR